ncbi:LysM peptidoglycan-binding domain-containing protein [Sorangium sp. So ce693]|uniref:LysM peptidoglycan-binding domain-containing protein n=1 Tax=Sorangium sp. So ce693 TaxID=3133318 RepID=UPI003F636F51
MFASLAVDDWRDDNVRVLQDMFCELTLSSLSSLHAYDQRVARELIGVRLRQALQRGELVAFREACTPASFVPRGVGAKTPEPRQPPLEAPATLSFYEITLLDELDAPIAGVRFSMRTPAGTFTRTTDAGGVARVDDLPPGIGNASVVGLAELQESLKERERKPRRTAPPPDGDAWHIRTLARALDPITVPSGERQYLMLVTRTDVFALVAGWERLSLADAAGPWTFHGGTETVLSLHADSAERKVQVLGQPFSLPEFLPPKNDPLPGEAERWEPPNIYIVQPGDTLSLIATRHLGAVDRWGEIWARNRASYEGRTPDIIYPGDRFVMPDDALPHLVARCLNRCAPTARRRPDGAGMAQHRRGLDS